MDEKLFFVLCELTGVLGMLAHYVKKRARKQTLDGLIEYIKGHPWFTGIALVATAGASWTVWKVADPGMIVGFDSLIATLTPAFLAGFALDSTINRFVKQGDEP